MHKTHCLETYVADVTKTIFIPQPEVVPWKQEALSHTWAVFSSFMPVAWYTHTFYKHNALFHLCMYIYRGNSYDIIHNLQTVAYKYICNGISIIKVFITFKRFSFGTFHESEKVQ